MEPQECISICRQVSDDDDNTTGDTVNDDYQSHNNNNDNENESPIRIIQKANDHNNNNNNNDNDNNNDTGIINDDSSSNSDQHDQHDHHDENEQEITMEELTQHMDDRYGYSNNNTQQEKLDLTNPTTRQHLSQEDNQPHPTQPDSPSDQYNQEEQQEATQQQQDDEKQQDATNKDGFKQFCSQSECNFTQREEMIIRNNVTTHKNSGLWTISYTLDGQPHVLWTRGCYAAKDDHNESLPKFIFQIHQVCFDDKTDQVEAICAVFMLLNKTLLGDTADNDEAFINKYGKYCLRAEKERVALSQLGRRVKLPKVSILYHVPSKERKSPGWYCSFQLLKDYQPSNQPIDLISEHPTSCELYSSIGINSLGQADAGFHVKYAVEKDCRRSQVCELNHSDMETVYHEKVETFLNKITNPKGATRFEKTHHIHASPPCQGFSIANASRYDENKNVENNKQLDVVADVIKACKPKTVTLENVPGLLYEPCMTHMEKLLCKLLTANYQAQVSLLDASWYGDPQKRPRVFVIGVEKEYKLPTTIPKPTHFNTDKSVMTVREAIGDLEQEQTKFEVDRKHGIRDHVEPTSNGHSMPLNASRTDPDKPVNTIRCNNIHWHYSKPRQLTNRELARLCSIPDDFRFIGKQREIRTDIGDCVPRKLACAVAKHVIDTCYDVLWISPTAEHKAILGRRAKIEKKREASKRKNTCGFKTKPVRVTPEKKKLKDTNQMVSDGCVSDQERQEQQEQQESQGDRQRSHKRVNETHPKPSPKRLCFGMAV